jgi:uncharacterized protein
MPSSFFIYNSTTQSLTINVLAKPSSKQNKISEAVEIEINGIPKKFIKIHIKAPPESGKANQKLIDFLSKYLLTPKSNIKIIFGHTSKCKILIVSQCNPKTIEKICEIYHQNI